MIGRNDPCWCGSGAKWKKCHFPIAPTVDLKTQYLKQYDIILKDEEQIQGIRQAGHLAASILDKVCAMAKAGVTTKALNDYAVELHQQAGAIPASLNYGHPPFPGAICTSLNEVICHGIPGPQALQEGDILNVDVACILNGYFGDCSKMVVVGKISAERQLVCDTAYECLMNAIQVVKPGALVKDIGEAIESHADKKGCSVVHQFVGHGVGIQFHEGPQVPHNRNYLNIQIVPNMTFTIEPMINAGSPEGVTDRKDGWTARTIDGKASAQFEHTLLVTEDGVEILTPWKR